MSMTPERMTDTNTTPALLPCPNPFHEHSASHPPVLCWGFLSCHIECSNCGLEGPSSDAIETDDDGETVATIDAEAEAIAACNRRTTPTPPATDEREAVARVIANSLGAKIGVSMYIMARAILDYLAPYRAAEIAAAHERATAAERERDALRETVIAFAGPHAVNYAKDFDLPDGHLHPAHYDILARCGARMDDFTRAALTANHSAPVVEG